MKITRILSFLLTLALVASSIPTTNIYAKEVSQKTIKFSLEDAERLESVIDIQKTGITVDVDKAYSVGFTEQEVNNLLATYQTINNEIKANRIIVKYNNYGKLDIFVNENQIKSSMNFKDISYTTRSADVTPHFNKVEIYIPADDCADIAAILAGGSVTVGVIAGLLGLAGLVPPAAIVLIVSGIIGIGSAYFWYCSNEDGLDIEYYYFSNDFKYSRRLKR